MRNKKGFTLVELLAVIVVLAIIMTIAGSAIMASRKKANDEEFHKLEKSIADLGPSIYSYEFLKADNEVNGFYNTYKSGNNFEVPLSELIRAGYLKGEIKSSSGYLKGEIKSPYNNKEGCEGFLLVTKSNEGPKFEGCLKCGSKKSECYTPETVNDVSLNDPISFEGSTQKNDSNEDNNDLEEE